MVNDDERRPQRLCRLRPGAGPARVICARDRRDDIIAYHVQGRVTLQNLMDAVESALDLGLAEHAVWNVVDGDLGDLSIGELGVAMSLMFSGPWAPRKCAVLMSFDSGSSLVGATRLATVADLQGFGHRVRTFADRAEALQWLGRRERSTLPAHPDSQAEVR